MLASGVIFAGCYLGAPAFAGAMGDPAATPVVRLLAASVLISGLVATPVALLQRGFQQARKVVADQVAAWTSTLVSVGGALAGMGR